MSSSKGRMLVSLTTALTALFLVSGGALASSAELELQSFQENDLVAAVSSGRVYWFDGSGPNQVFYSSLNTTRGGFTTGMTFDADRSLFVTNFSDASVSKFDLKGALLDDRWAVTTTTQPECIVRDQNGDFYVTSAAWGGLVHKFSPDGTFLRTFDFNPLDIGRGGTDWMDLARDNCTMFFTVEDGRVRTYDICKDAGPLVFSVELPGEESFAVRILPDERVLVANLEVIVLLNPDGTIDTTYDVTGIDYWFSLTVVKGCQEFWAGDTESGRAYRFDIETGAGLDNYLEVLDTGAGPDALYGLSIVGECLVALQEDLVSIDIKPTSCPNPINVKSQGVLPVAVLGSPAFDVSDIDASSLLLEGVPPLRTGIEDVATPFPGDLCDCWTEGPDGFEDLTLKFDTQEIVAALGEVNDSDTLELTLEWTLLDGTVMEGSDCVLILKKPAPRSKSWIASSDVQIGTLRHQEADVFALYQNSPNPFRGETSIRFSLPKEAHAILTIHDVGGRTVATLVDEPLSRGVHSVVWKANAPSGIYFSRLRAGGETSSGRLVLLP